jgi:hypothetical protein
MRKSGTSEAKKDDKKENEKEKEKEKEQGERQAVRAGAEGAVAFHYEVLENRPGARAAGRERASKCKSVMLRRTGTFARAPIRFADLARRV